MKFGDTQVALECKERGELLGVLWDHFWSVVDVRAGLEAEERLAELHTKYVALVGSNSGLEQDVKVRCSHRVACPGGGIRGCRGRPSSCVIS